MGDHSGTTPVWVVSAALVAERLSGDVESGVCMIGAGIAGLSTA
jgi:hypothetical protein